MKTQTLEEKHLEVLRKTNPELLKIVGKHSTLWNYPKPETVEKINDLLQQAGEVAVEEYKEALKNYIEEERVDGHMPFYSDDFENMFKNLEEK